MGYYSSLAGFLIYRFQVQRIVVADAPIVQPCPGQGNSEWKEIDKNGACQQFPERSLLACANVLATHDLRAGCPRRPKADLRDAGGGGSDCGAGGGDTLGGTGFAAIG